MLIIVDRVELFIKGYPAFETLRYFEYDGGIHMTHNHVDNDFQDDGEEMEMEDLVGENSLLLDALIKLLIKKKMITEKEFEDCIEELKAEEE